MRTPLATVKDHLRIEFPDHDALLTVHITVAEEYLRSVGVDMTVDPLPAPLTAAVLLMVAQLFDHPDTAGFPPIVDRLIAPYREATA